MLLQTKNPQQLYSSFNKEFEQFFEYCDSLKLTKSEKDKIFAPLKWQLRFEFWRQILMICLGIISGIWTIYYIPFLNWNFTAIGRIGLIKILPIWDWKSLYSQKCLIDWNTKTIGDSFDGKNINNSLEIDKFYSIDCSTCINYENVVNLNTTPPYDYIYEKFLIRGLPVIIKGSCPVWQTNNFTEYLLTLDNLIDSNPCDLHSNLILEKYANIEELLTLSLRADPNEGWFLHFLNCDFEAVKSSRLISHRPSYLSTHLDPAVASWIIMSKNYNDGDFIDLKLNGLIVMLQLKGQLEIYLTGKDQCLDECGEHKIILDEGDGLVFTTDLWELSYRPSSHGESINFATETYWNP